MGFRRDGSPFVAGKTARLNIPDFRIWDFGEAGAPLPIEDERDFARLEGAINTDERFSYNPGDSRAVHRAGRQGATTCANEIIRRRSRNGCRRLA